MNTRILSICFVLAGIVAAPQAFARQVDHAAATSAHDQIVEAENALARGDISAAKALLDEVAATAVTQNDLDFLYGMIAAAQRDYRGAIARFSALLERDPSLNRVRLELARTYFMRGDDAAAEYHFRAAAAQGVPPVVQANIDAFLAALKHRKRWEATFSMAAVPDSNINAATAAHSVDIFGLPFELADSARQRSGVGLALNLSAAYQWDVVDDTKLRAGVVYSGTEYARSMFTDRQVGLYAGPRFQVSKSTDVSVLATASRRWYGGVPLTYGVGGRVETRTTLSPRWLLEGAFSGQHLHYNSERYPAYSGPTFSTAGVLTYALDASSFLRVNGGVGREQTAVAGYRNTQYLGGGGYYRENLPGRFAIYAGVQGTVLRYDEKLAAFASVRHDSEVSYRFSISNKYVGVWGFRPVISYVHTDHTSNIAIFSYHRDHGEIGITRNF